MLQESFTCADVDGAVLLGHLQVEEGGTGARRMLRFFPRHSARLRLCQGSVVDGAGLSVCPSFPFWKRPLYRSMFIPT